MPKVGFDDDDSGDEEDAGLQDDGFDVDESGKAYTMNCRMYENQFPEIDDVVMVTVRSIAEMGAYVCLNEYNNIEGMILLSELSRRRIRSVNKLIRVGKKEVCMVLRVDKEKGYIDLSKRRVSAEDVAKCDERFNKSKAVHSIMRHISEVKAVDGARILRDGKVYMRKQCPTHGQSEALISGDVDWFLKSLTYVKEGSRPLQYATDVDKGCPDDCGLCPDHEQHSCLPIIEITNHCNLECPICIVQNRHNYR